MKLHKPAHYGPIHALDCSTSPKSNGWFRAEIHDLSAQVHNISVWVESAKHVVDISLYVDTVVTNSRTLRLKHREP